MTADAVRPGGLEPRAAENGGEEPDMGILADSAVVGNQREVVSLCVDYCAGGPDWDDWGPVCARCGRPVLRDEVCCPACVAATRDGGRS